jgi:isopenicillin N synthase-like dioxygenase
MEIGKEPSSTFQNNWPRDGLLDGFHEFEMDFYRACHLLHLDVMNSLGLAFGLEEGFFLKYCDKSDHTLRLLHYPSVSKDVLDRAEQARTGAHTVYY